jgi:hypothetical protein
MYSSNESINEGVMHRALLRTDMCPTTRQHCRTWLSRRAEVRRNQLLTKQVGIPMPITGSMMD